MEEDSNVTENNNEKETYEMETNTSAIQNTNEKTLLKPSSQKENTKRENEILSLISNKELPDETFSLLQRSEHTVLTQIHKTSDSMQYDEID